METYSIVVGNEYGEHAELFEEFATGMAPFWLTNDLFGYINWSPTASVPPTQVLNVASAINSHTETILETADLLNQLPEGANSGQGPLFIRYAIVHPTDADQLFVMASFRPESSYLFQVNRQTQEVRLILELDLSRSEHTIGFSPDGRYLTTTSTWWQDIDYSGDEQSFGALTLVDLETGDQQTILTDSSTFLPAFTFDWSQDGNWLAFTRNRNAIGLIAPSTRLPANYLARQWRMHLVGLGKQPAKPIEYNFAMRTEKEKVQQQFGANAAFYATSTVHAKGYSLTRLVELTQPQPSWQVLDIATAAGHTAFVFAPHVAQVIATDLTPEMLTVAANLAEEKRITNVTFEPADAEQLPFPDGQFDWRHLPHSPAPLPGDSAIYQRSGAGVKIWWLAGRG